MTTLAARPLNQLEADQLTLSFNDPGPLAQLHRDDFHKACIAVADADGIVNPNDVLAELKKQFGEINPRWYSAAWSAACSKNGFMTTLREHRVPCDPTHSRGNGNKTIPLRQLRTSF